MRFGVLEVKLLVFGDISGFELFLDREYYRFLVRKCYVILGGRVVILDMVNGLFFGGREFRWEVVLGF